MRRTRSSAKLFHEWREFRTDAQDPLRQEGVTQVKSEKAET